ncbi:hypothetical protein pb186bvf_007726 [Paramecium bursaria]
MNSSQRLRATLSFGRKRQDIHRRNCFVSSFKNLQKSIRKLFENLLRLEQVFDDKLNPIPVNPNIEEDEQQSNSIDENKNPGNIQPSEIETTDYKTKINQLRKTFYQKLQQYIVKQQCTQNQAALEIQNLSGSNIYEVMRLQIQQILVDVCKNKKCCECDYTYSQDEEIYTHQFLTHLTDVKIYLCVVCKRSFENFNYLSRHIRLNHEEDTISPQDSQSRQKNQKKLRIKIQTLVKSEQSSD